jgi:hypothetical protein
MNSELLRRIPRLLFALQILFGCAAVLHGEGVLFQTKSFRAELGDDAVWQSLTETQSGRSLLGADRKTPITYVQVGGKTYSANSATRDGNELVVGFAGIDTKLQYKIEQADNWVTFRLERIVGTRPQQITFFRISVGLTDHVGSRLNGAWDEQTAVVLRGANRQTLCRPTVRAESTELTASAQDEPGPKLEGSAASLFVVPTAALRTVMARYAEAYGLPTNTTPDGVASKDTQMARGSYWFLSFAEDEVDQVIDCCRKTGFHQVMLNSGAWCTSSGHYLFSTDRYPDGIESLKRTVDRLHNAGILAGMHCFASKVSKIDPYVTPVPDHRFLVDRTAALADDLSADSTTVRTASDLSQWPGSPVAKQKVWEGTVEKHQEVVIDDEIIQYESIGLDGKWDTFLGCRRGAWGTKAAVHKADTEGRHYAVDGCINGYIIDQETDLLDEVTDRLAEIFNTCGFDMVYFDGCEDVDRRRFDYYAANFQAVAMSKLKKRPIIHKGGGFHHNLWHSFTSSATIDQYPGTYLAYLRAGGTIDQWPTCKDHIDRTAKRVVACQDDLIPGELGWFGINPADGEYDGLQYDEVEYLMCKSLAYDSPISLQTSFSRMEQHPLTEDILLLIKRYEALRHHQYGRIPIARFKKLSEDDLERLKTPGRDFVVDTDLWDAPMAVELTRVAMSDNDVRVWLGTVGDARLLRLWHSRGRDGELILDANLLSESFTVTEDLRDDTSGTFKRHLAKEGKIALPVDHRYRAFGIRGVPFEGLQEAMKAARFTVRPPQRIWIQATDFSESAGTMAKGSAVGIEDPNAIGDFIVCTGKIDRLAESLPYCEYRVNVPKKAVWTLWARVRYPGGGDMSFGFVPDREEVTLDGNQVIGNCGVNEAKWHWTGRGGGVTTVPPGAPIRLKLDDGEHTFRIYPREGPGTAETNPRLDVMCLCESPDDMPTDSEARKHLAR